MTGGCQSPSQAPAEAATPDRQRFYALLPPFPACHKAKSTYCWKGCSFYQTLAFIHALTSMVLYQDLPLNFQQFVASSNINRKLTISDPIHN
jgi:hypothetical protein